MDPDSAKERLQIDDRYRDATLIAERGLANTYSAIDSTTGARVFLKILRESKLDDPATFHLFCQEPALLQRIARDEPHLPVPRILATGYWEQRPYFTQPFLDGWSLDVPLKQRVCFSVSSIFRIFEDCLEFLSKLHEAGIFHGDVSPDNIFIKTDEPISDDGSLPTAFSLLLLDYNGSIRFDKLNARPSKQSVVFVKLPYAAPELVRSGQKSAQSDLYSLGVVLFELLVGSRPHPDPKSLSDIGSLRDAKIPRMPDALGIPLPIESFVRRLLYGDPTHRFESAAECLSELRAFSQVGPWLEQATSRETLRYRLLPNGVHFVTGSSSHSVPEPVLSELRPITLVPTAPHRVKQDWETTGRFVVPREPIGAAYPSPNSQQDSGHTVEYPSPEEPDRDIVSLVYGVPLPVSGQGETGIDLVDFSIFAPSTVQPASSFILELWAYMRLDRDEALERASKRGRLIERGSRGPVYLPGRSELTIVLRLDGFELQDAQDTILWASEITNVAFIVSVPNGMSPGDYPGQLSILHNGLLLARVVFEITVGNHVDKQVNLSIQREELKSAFASYASVDRDEVLRRVQGIQATGIDVFVDVLSLRSGADWEAELYRHIRSRDIFYLFWSNAARASEWVAREWHYALEEKGLDFIHPIPLAPPDQVPPPEELRSKHFDDIILACLKSQKVAALVE